MLDPVYRLLAFGGACFLAAFLFCFGWMALRAALSELPGRAAAQGSDEEGLSYGRGLVVGFLMSTVCTFLYAAISVVAPASQAGWITGGVTALVAAAALCRDGRRHGKERADN